jgi:hypothetical protein
MLQVEDDATSGRRMHDRSHWMRCAQWPPRRTAYTGSTLGRQPVHLLCIKHMQTMSGRHVINLLKREDLQRGHILSGKNM